MRQRLRVLGFGCEASSDIHTSIAHPHKSERDGRSTAAKCCAEVSRTAGAATCMCRRNSDACQRIGPSVWCRKRTVRNIIGGEFSERSFDAVM